jgi:hypothetical protein
MNVSIFRRLVSNKVCFLILSITLSLSGKSMAVPPGLSPITDSDLTSTVCAQDLDPDPSRFGLTYCDTRYTNTNFYNITAASVPPSTGNGLLPTTGTFKVYDVNCPANGKTVTHFVNGGPSMSPSPVDVSCIPVIPPVAKCVLPPNTTMVAWYPFDETFGTTAADLAAGNTGTHFGSPLALPGEVAGALSFDGINDYVEAPSTMNINFGPANTPAQCAIPLGGYYSSCLGDFSIDVWVNLPPNTPNNVVKVIVDKRGQSPLQGYSFFLGQNGRLGLQLASGGTFTNYSSGSYPPFAPFAVPYDGNWHHIAVTVDRRVGLFGVIKWYVDGSPLTVSASTTVFGSLVNNSPLRIGTRTAASPLSGWFFGDMDELEIFNRVLTSNEVRGIFLASTLGKCKTLPPPPPPPCGGNPSTC